MVIADTGFWVALLDQRDALHARAAQAAQRWDAEGFVTTHAVIAEACQLLRVRRYAAAMSPFIDTLVLVGCEIADFPATDLPRVERLMKRYENLPMDYADASLVLLAERLRHGRILTTDERDFGAYRWKNSYPFENLLEAGA